MHKAPIAIVDEDSSPLSVRIASAFFPPRFNPPRLKATDRNIDHRRVGNLQTLFARLGADLPPSADAKTYLPGDIVSWLLPGNLPHIGIVSDQWTVDRSTPLVLHNIGAGAAEDDILFAFQMTGHYRLTPDVMDKLKMLGTN